VKEGPTYSEAGSALSCLVAYDEGAKSEIDGFPVVFMFGASGVQGGRLSDKTRCCLAGLPNASVNDHPTPLSIHPVYYIRSSRLALANQPGTKSLHISMPLGAQNMPREVGGRRS